jgi:agmatine deiminase
MIVPRVSERLGSPDRGARRAEPGDPDLGELPWERRRAEPLPLPGTHEDRETDPFDDDLGNLGHTPVAPLASVIGPLRVPGEFEPQEALLVTPGLLAKDHPEVFVSLVRAVHRRVTLVGVVASRDEQLAVGKLLNAQRLPATAVQLVHVPHNTMWIRDYGPIFVRLGDEMRMAIDADYPEAGRGDDDLLPHAMADFFRVELHRAPLVFEGGNFLSNGLGLCIVTSSCLERNFADPDAERLVHDVFRECFGAEQTVLLEPLFGEATGHVDMFAAFTSVNTVVIGQCDPAADAENAELLNRNAAMLAGLPTPAGPLRVVRIPLPVSEDGCWRSFTNVVFANGVLLVPTYKNVDRRLQVRAMRTYRSLLPGWKIVGIDSSDIINNGGALHCVTANVPKGKSVVAAPRGTVRRGPSRPLPALRRQGPRPGHPGPTTTAA